MQVARRERVERVVVHQARATPHPRRGRGSRARTHRAPGPSSSGRPGPVAVPERHLARLARRRGHGDPLERDVLDPPRRRTEHERLARTALVDHLLVEFADTGAVGQEHTEQPSVGDRAAGGDRQPLGSVAGAQPVVDAVPHDARPQLGELLTRVPPGQQIEHVVEQIVGDLGEVRTASDQRGDRRRPSTPRRRPRAPRSAGRARRAGCAGSGSTRSAPSTIRRVTTAASSRSPRCFGKIEPRDGSPTGARRGRCAAARG